MGRGRVRRLQLGCFDCTAPGWYNTDITPHIFIARVPFLASLVHAAGLMTAERLAQHRAGVFREVHYLDVRRRFPLDDGTVEAVFASHFLEHLFADQAAFCVAEIHRVLKPGGICRISVPDLDQMVAEYDPGSPESFLKRIFEVSDRRLLKNAHHWHYNARSLTGLLRGAGFRESYRCEYRSGRCPDVLLLDNRPEETLFVEGVK